MSTNAAASLNGLPVLFPGQGAQYSGMGREWTEVYPRAAETFQEADEALGFSLSDKCWHSGDEVNRTDIAQPGILTTGVAIIRTLEQHGFDRERMPLTAGLSLGEYTALWAAGVLEFQDAVRLVRLRGEAMQAASEATPSGMVSLMGADEASATSLAAAGAEVGVCQVANLNSPAQIILSGELAALDRVEEVAREHGIRRTRRLVVAGGFHSECMRPAADSLASALAEVELHAPRVPVISNVTARPVEGVEQVRELLAAQVCSPVLWEKSMRHATGSGHSAFVECGPGEVLAGLLRKIEADASTTRMTRPEDLEAKATSS